MNKFKIGDFSNITSTEAEIDDSVIIGKNVQINCDYIKLGKNCVIGNNVSITCKRLEVGDWLYMTGGVEIGRGGCMSPDSIVKIGNNVGIFEKTIINPSSKVEIGDNVGIGAEVMIWTHGAWLNPLQGYPTDFGPVTIGNNVWLPARSIVLPNVTIGDDTVIGIGSVVNRDIPSGSLAAGAPCKVIKENQYPMELDNHQKDQIVWQIVRYWQSSLEHKGIDNISTDYEGGKIRIKRKEDKLKITCIDVFEKYVAGYQDDISEDLRDFLRRFGIKIYTDRHFKSIPIKEFQSETESFVIMDEINETSGSWNNGWKPGDED